MSRVGKMPIALPTDAQVSISGQKITIKGAKGCTEFHTHSKVLVRKDGFDLRFEASDDSMFANAMSGTTRALVNNLIFGVTKGFERKLTLVGVGYRAQVQGKKLNLVIGLSHPVNYTIPAGITIETPSQTEVVVKGVSKELVGQVAATIRDFRPPEPYKGKGIRYADEVISLKETKKE